jgi:hypothetical protein
MRTRAVRWTLSLVVAASVALLGVWAAPSASAAADTSTAPTLSATSVLPGQQVTVTGTGCKPSGTPEGVFVVLLNGATPVTGANGAATPGQINATTGAWSVTLTVPTSTGPGTYTVASNCDNYYAGSHLTSNYPGVQLVVAAPVLPGVQLSPSTVQVGGSFDITGENFVPNESVTAELHSAPVSLGTATAKSDGTVALTATVPAGTALGQHQVQLVGTAGDSASAVLTVIAASASPASHNQLAATGTNSNLTIEGLLMLVIGLATVMFTWQWTIASERARASRRKQLTYRPAPGIRWDC